MIEGIAYLEKSNTRRLLKNYLNDTLGVNLEVVQLPHT